MRILVIILIFSICFSCKKEEPLKPPPWERFVGNYKVYDTESNTSYLFSIFHFSARNQYNVEVDSFRINNLNNMFYYNILFSPNLDENFFDLGFYAHIYDKYEKRWFITSEFDDTTTVFKENVLHNDSILLSYRISNCPYYQEDSVPLAIKYLKQLAVKQYDE